MAKMANEALETVVSRNHFYRDNYRRVLSALLLMVVINVGLVGVVLYQVSHRPSPEYFATSADGKITKLSPLSTPVVPTHELLQWANTAAVAVNTYTFVNYRKELQTASEYFTPDGWRNYQKALKDSGNLDMVTSRRLIATAVATGAPVVIDQGLISGRYAWKVQIPLLVTYESASTNIKQPITVTMIITRVPVLNIPKGIAIAQFYASDRSTTEGNS